MSLRSDIKFCKEQIKTKQKLVDKLAKWKDEPKKFVAEIEKQITNKKKEIKELNKQIQEWQHVGNERKRVWADEMHDLGRMQEHCASLGALMGIKKRQNKMIEGGEE
jgi:chromosome segregation ATPase